MSGLGLGLGLGLGAHRIVDRYGNKPATFSIPAGFEDVGTKRINFSEPVTVTITGGVTLSIGSTQYQSGDTIPVASSYHTLTINNPGTAAGTITFGKRKQITYLSMLYSPFRHFPTKVLVRKLEPPDSRSTCMPNPRRQRSF